MSFRTILANLNETANNTAVAASAITLAREFDARVTGLYVIPAAPVYPSAYYEPIPEMFEAHRKHFEGQLPSVRKTFEAAFVSGTSCNELCIENSSSPLICESVIERGRVCDLILVSQTETASGRGVELGFVPRIAVAAGRPLMVIPFNSPLVSPPETIVVGWNGSRESARAVFDSLPLLRRAKMVHLVWIDPPAARSRIDSLPAEGIAQSLCAHGVKAVATAVDGDGWGAGEIILRNVADLGAGLLVIGAYGHSRFSEFVLGGVTRTVLRQMSCPVLLSH